ncbi:hypothetical protein [Emticicia sp.]|uniref:hypothetical protein n=1 Tax=Emticicia sp. TaxID=1930953 RepID=UPI00375201D8
MASKLFIFAIGGTGSRVVKALTMLLASGVELKNTSEVIPIIIDPHKSNEDLKRTESLLKTYKKIRDSLTEKPKTSEFFGTEIKTLKNIISNNDRIADNYTFELKGVSNETFGNYIDFDNLSGSADGFEMYEPNKDLASLLFSKKNLATEMNIGFVGNPNIGSVVLNQFKESEEFKQFAANFAKDDRIFIISSIFGGTGAAGFPIILKNIRGAEAGELDSPEYLKNAKIGALTVLPYFGLEPNDEKRVDKATFYSKAKAALHYYSRGVNKSVNKFYYIGDELNNNYKYDPGENGQKNDAHFVELASAMAIVDFAATDNSDLENEKGLPLQSVYKEFGIRSEANKLDFSHLGNDTLQVICRDLTKMTLLNLYMEYHLGNVVGTTLPWLSEDNKIIDRGFMSGLFYKTHLGDFKRSYFEWLNEMARNTRGFQPFNLTADLAQLIVGVELKKSWNPLADKNYFRALDESLNSFCIRKHFSSVEDKFFKAFGSGSDTFLNEKFSNLFKNLN